MVAVGGRTNASSVTPGDSSFSSRRCREEENERVGTPTHTRDGMFRVFQDGGACLPPKHSFASAFPKRKWRSGGESKWREKFRLWECPEEPLNKIRQLTYRLASISRVCAFQTQPAVEEEEEQGIMRHLLFITTRDTPSVSDRSLQ